jgi:hypothetical protein
VDADALDALLEEYGTLPRPQRDPELESIALAILLEDRFDLTLTDPEIAGGALDDPAAVRRLLADREGRP